MPLALSHATNADMDRLMEIQFAAFVPVEPYHEVLFPGGNTAATRAEGKERTLKWLRADPNGLFLKVIDTDTGTTVSGAKWSIYRADPNRDQRFKVDWYQPGPEKDYAEYAVNEVHRRRVERMRGPHCCDHHPFLL